MMKKYDSYRETGIDWLKGIPRDWEVKRLKYLADIGTGNKDTENKEETGEYPFFVRSKKIERISSFSFDGEAILTAGDGDICKIWHYINGKFDYHQRVYRISDFREVNGKYLYYYLLINFKEEVEKLSAKSTVDSLRRPMFLNFPVAFGDIDEQIKIAKYLDCKVGQLEETISKKTILINMLKEERVALINKCVSKGIDNKAIMNVGEFDWLGVTPSHWKSLKLRYVGKCQNGISAGAEYFGSGSPFVSYGDVYKNEELPNEVTGLAQSSEKEQEHYAVKEGDILFTRTSETVDEIGIASICMKDIENAVFAGFLIRFRPFDGLLDKKFSKYYFQSFIPRVFFVKEMNLVTRASLSQELLKRLPVLLPPFAEQKEIGEFLDSQTSQIDNQIDKAIKKIEFLKEYKTALISEVVTGKVDVRNIELN